MRGQVQIRFDPACEEEAHITRAFILEPIGPNAYPTRLV